jgi:MFS family permease
MALFGVIGGIGRTIGPIIGGFLSTPAELYPRTFKNTIFERFPFALPSLIISANCLVILLVSYLYLDETLPLSLRNSQSNSSNSSVIVRKGRKITGRNGSEEDENSAEYSLLHSEEDDESGNGTGAGDIDEYDRQLDDIERNMEKKSKERSQQQPTKQNGSMIELPRMFPSSSSSSAASFLSPSSPGSVKQPFLIEEDAGRVEEDESWNPLLLPPSTTSTASTTSSSGGKGPPELIPFHDLDRQQQQQQFQQQYFEERTPSGKIKPPNRRLTFNGIVEIKTIGSNELDYSSLKAIKAAEQPVTSLKGIAEEEGYNEEQRIHSLGQEKEDALEEEEEESDEGDDDEDDEDDEEKGKQGIKEITAGQNENGNGFLRPENLSEKVTLNGERNYHLQQNEKKEKKVIDKKHRRKKKKKVVRYSNGSEDFYDENNNFIYSRSIDVHSSFFVKIRYLLSRKEIFISTLLYGTNALTMIAINEIFPLFLVTPKSLGGFEFTSDKIGIATMIVGIISIVLQIALYPKLVEWYGTLGTYRLTTMLFAFACLLTPLISFANRCHWIISWTMVILGQLGLTVPGSFSLVTVFVFINNSCYSQHRATVNGLGQTFASLGRLIGPYLGAILFAWSDTNKLSWPLNHYFTFYLTGILTIANVYLGASLPRSIERRKREPKVAHYTLSVDDDLTSSPPLIHPSSRSKSPSASSASSSSSFSSSVTKPLSAEFPSLSPLSHLSASVATLPSFPPPSSSPDRQQKMRTGQMEYHRLEEEMR